MSKGERTFGLRPTAYEITCQHCSHPFRVMRTKNGTVKCPYCRRPALAWGEKGHVVDATEEPTA